MAEVYSDYHGWSKGEGGSGEMHERLYRRPGTAFRSNKAQLLRGFKTAEERQIAKTLALLTGSLCVGQDRPPMVRGNSPGEKTISSGIDDLWQMDLADLTDKMDENDDYRFMLTVIDVFQSLGPGLSLS